MIIRDTFAEAILYTHTSSTLHRPTITANPHPHHNPKVSIVLNKY